MKFTRKLFSAVAVTLCASIGLTFPTQVLAQNLPVRMDYDDSENEYSPEIVSELTKQREEHTKYFRLSDGSTMAAQYEYPVHFKDSNNDWVDYDNSLSVVNTDTATNDEASSEEFDYGNNNSNIDVNLSNKSKLNNMIKLNHNNYHISWGYDDTNKSTAKIIEKDEDLTGDDAFLARPNLISETLYEEIYDNTDLQCLITPVGVKENFILKNSNAKTDYEIQYKFNNLTAIQKDDNTIELIDSNDEVVYVIDAPYMTDSNGNSSTAVSLEITSQKNSKLTVKLSADKEWLNASDRSYPVTVDPAFYTTQEWQHSSSTFVDSYRPNLAPGYAGTDGFVELLSVGSYGLGTYRSYFKINELPSLNKGDMVVAAVLNMHSANNDFYDDMYIGAFQVTESWNQATMTWNTRAGFNGTMLDYEIINPGETGQELWHEWDVTKIVKEWYNGTPNYGIILKSLDESSEGQCADFFSSSYPSSQIPRPLFKITYRNNKGLEDMWSHSSFSVGTAGTAYINDYSGNLTFITSDISTISNMPSTLQHVYNGYASNEHFTSSFPYAGKGWKLNYQQTVKPSSEYSDSEDLIENWPYVYTDEDGTEHYFLEETEDGNTVYKDEGGLKLELTVNSSSTDERYTIIDEKDNKRIFNSDGVLVKSLNSNGKGSTITLDSAKGFNRITDPFDNSFTFNRNSEHCITRVLNSAGRAKRFLYDSNERLIEIRNVKDATSDVNSGTVINSIYFTYDSDGALESITDIDGYKVVFGYSNLDSGKKVTSVTEYASDGTEGQKITFDRTKYNLTEIRTSGLDGNYNTSDDCISAYQFDNYGRTVSVENRLHNGEKMGASTYTYTAAEPDSTNSNLKKLNRVTSNYAATTNVQNLLKNHSLESSSYWTNINQNSSISYSAAPDTGEKYFGQKSMEVIVTTAGEDSRCGVKQTLGNSILVPGQTYTLSAYVKTENIASGTNVGAIVGVKTDLSDGTYNQYDSEHVTGTTDTNINDGWQRIYTTFTVPENTTDSCVYLVIRGATGTAYFDGVQLEEGNVPNKYNMLQNSNMETVSSNGLPTFWGHHNLTLGSSSDYTSIETKCDGTRSFKICGDATTNKQIYQDIAVSGSEDDTYIFSAWAKGDSVAVNDDNVRFDLYVEIRYADGSVKSKKPQSFNKAFGYWQYSSFTFNLSDETDSERVPTKVTVFLRFTKQYNTAYFDNAQLIKDSTPSYTYNDDGELVTVVSNSEQKSTMEYSDSNLTKSIDAKGYAYTYDYDDNHNMTKATSQNGIEYNYTYNDKGQATDLEVNDSGKTLVLKSNLEYNGNGRFVHKIYDQDGKSVTYNYNTVTGFLDSVTDDELGATVNYTYDENNGKRLSVSQTDSYTDITISDNYTYSNSGKLLTKINHANTDYNIVYDAFGNITKNLVGTQLLTEFDYGENNHLLQQITYGNGQKINYNYDKYGNVSEWLYDGILAFSSESDKTGVVMRHKDFINNRQYDYDYDTTGRLVRQVKSDISKSESENRFVSAYEYSYDLNNNVTKLASKNGSSSIVHSYNYDKDNLPKEYSSSVSDSVSYTYDGLNRLTKTSVGTDSPIEMSYTYYDSERDDDCTTTKIKEETIGSDTYQYYYDTSGNITDIYKKNGATYDRLYWYEYDEFNQLVNTVDYEKRISHRYEYDEAGNILSEAIGEVVANNYINYTQTINYAYNDANWGDKLTGYNGQTFTYDAIGNPLTYRDGMTMTWQNGRSLTSLQQGSNSISYKYDSNYVRTSKIVNGVECTYEYLGNLLMHETRGDKTFDYCYDANGQLYAVSYKASSTAASETYYFSHNWHGDIVGIYNTQGTLVASYEYDAWGNVISVADSNGNSINNDNHIANLNPFRYRGYYYDSETGLYYLMSRYYDPVTHRFVNADGYFQSGGNILDTNMNAYCRNNPVMYSDPNGKHTECGAPNCCFCRKEYRDFINANVDWYNRVTGKNILGVDFSGNFVYPAKIEIDKESTEYKVLRSTGIFFESFEASADAGFGVGYEKIILKVINLEATSKAAVRVEISGHSGFDVGTYGGNSFGVSAWDVGVEGGTTFFDSFITGERKVNVGSERSISYSSGIYVLVGASYSVGFNYGHFMDETSKVW